MLEIAAAFCVSICMTSCHVDRFAKLPRSVSRTYLWRRAARMISHAGAAIQFAVAVDPARMISSIGSAMAGMASAMSRFDRASADIASEKPADPIRDRVEQITAQHDVEANAATIRTADDMLGTLIDTFA